MIKHVIKIERLDMSQLGSPSVIDCAQVAFSAPVVGFAEICIKRPAKCVVTSNIENGERVFTSELSFESAEKLPDARSVFRFTSADGCAYMVGLNEKPMPQLTWTETFPGTMTESPLRAYKVTWTGKYPPLLII